MSVPPMLSFVIVLTNRDRGDGQRACSGPGVNPDEVEEDRMRVNEFMTKEVATCSTETPIVEVARLMVKHDCGEIPITTSDTRHLAGVVTDRDIVCRAVATGRDTAQMPAGECMTTPVVCVTRDATMDECRAIMEENQVRRVPVVDDKGMICGIVSQADIARSAGARDTGHLVSAVSEPTPQPSRVVVP